MSGEWWVVVVSGGGGVMPYEVEQKFPVADLAVVRERLVRLGFAPAGVVDQSDCYYRHPARDFAQTDEALRLRRVGQSNVLTYKGPKIDAATKSRFEQEAPLADGDEAGQACDAIFRRLGFEPVAVVAKRRETLRLQRGASTVEAALDAVAGVGTFVELEIGVAAEDDAAAVAQARGMLAELAAELGLADSERRSYLELLLAAGPG